MKSFDDWFKKTMPNTYKGVGKEKIETFAYQTAEDAWNTKQQEVDELQKRIDLIVDLVRDNTPDYWLDNMIQDILKGETHES